MKNISKLAKSSNYLYKSNIFLKIISKNASITACTVDLSFKTNYHKIYLITQHQARQQIPKLIVDFSKIRAILNRYGLILCQVSIIIVQVSIIIVQVGVKRIVGTLRHTKFNTYTYICTFMYTYRYIHMSVYTILHTYMQIQILMYTYICGVRYLKFYTHIRIHKDAFLFTHIFVHIYVGMHVCTHT